MYIGGTKKPERVRRCVIHLLKALAEHKPSTKVKVHIYYAVAKDGEKLLKKCQMVGPDEEGGEDKTVADAMEGLKGFIITPTEVIQRITALVAELGEFCDINTVSITAMFDTHGIAGTTYANPATDITEPKAGMMYQAIKSHAEAYKDQLKKVYGMNIGSNIILPGDGGAGGLVGPGGKKL